MMPENSFSFSLANCSMTSCLWDVCLLPSKHRGLPFLPARNVLSKRHPYPICFQKVKEMILGLVEKRNIWPLKWIMSSKILTENLKLKTMAEDSDYFKTSMVPGLTLDFLDPLLYKVSSLTPNFHRRRENEESQLKEKALGNQTPTSIFYHLVWVKKQNHQWLSNLFWMAEKMISKC